MVSVELSIYGIWVFVAWLLILIHKPLSLFCSSQGTSAIATKRRSLHSVISETEIGN
ncbi:hypothetical protein LINGRAHAP2_LOCUS17405 [Linum grandiflorum]